MLAMTLGLLEDLSEDFSEEGHVYVKNLKLTDEPEWPITPRLTLGVNNIKLAEIPYCAAVTLRLPNE